MKKIAVIYRKKDNLRHYESNNVIQNMKSINQGISIITCTNRPNYINNIFKNYSRQNHSKKEMIVILNNNNMNINNYNKFSKQLNNIKVFQLDQGITLGECKNFAFKHVNYDHIAFFDDDDYYGSNFLTQTLYAFGEHDCDIVGKSSFYIYFEASKLLAVYHNTMKNAENQYVNHIVDSSMVITRKVFEKIKFPKIKGVGETIEFEKDCVKNGFKIYSTDRYNYTALRHPNPTQNHTWQESEDDILVNCEIIGRNVYNFTRYINNSL